MDGVSSDGRALLVIAAAVILANLPYLIGVVDPNPLGMFSGITSVTHGLSNGMPTLDSNSGLVSQAIGHRAAIDLLHLHMPWWDPYEGTGTPLAGEMQAAALFPLTLLTAISNGQLYEHIALELIAGSSTFLLLRRLGLRRAVGTVGGIAFGLNGTFAWFTNAAVNPVAFLPLLLLGIELAHSAAITERRGGWWLIAVAGALSLYAGFPEVAYLNTLLAVLWTLWRAAGLSRPQLGSFALKVVLGATAGTLLSAPLIISFVDYLNHSYLWLHGSDALSHLRLSHLSFAQLLFPYIYGPLNGPGLGFLKVSIWFLVGGYLSTSLLLLGVLGLCSRGRRGLRFILLVWIVFALSGIYDVPPISNGLFGVIPGMSQVEFVRYAFPSLELAVTVLAAVGLDEVSGGALGRRRALGGAVFSLGLVVLAIRQADPLQVKGYFPAAVAWGSVMVLVVGAAALSRFARARTTLLCGLVALDALTMFVVPDLAAPPSARIDLNPVTFLRAHLGETRFFTTGPLVPNYGAYFGLASLNAMDVPVPSRYARYVHTLDPGVDATAFTGALFDPFRSKSLPTSQQELLLHLAGYRAAAVSYVVTAPGIRLPESRATFQLRFKSPTTWIYHLSGASSYFTVETPGCQAISEDRTSARTLCSQATTLVRRETDLPGWSASVDGHPATIDPTSGLFQAVTVPSGSHRVTFDYEPPNIGLGLAAFAIGCLMLCLSAGVNRRRAT